MDRDRLRSLFDMAGRVVIVTGATRGIGRALAEGHAAAGARVVVASRKPEACKEAPADAAHGAPGRDGGPALLLTSDAGSFVTGQVVFADGGMVPR